MRTFNEVRLLAWLLAKGRLPIRPIPETPQSASRCTARLVQVPTLVACIAKYLPGRVQRRGKADTQPYARRSLRLNALASKRFGFLRPRHYEGRKSVDGVSVFNNLRHGAPCIWHHRAPQSSTGSFAREVQRHHWVCASFLDPQRTLPGCQRLQEDVQPQRQEFPIRVHRENGDLR